MKMKVTIAFQSDEMKRLNLGSKKTGLLIDFISVLPVIATKAATRENILFDMHENAQQRYSQISCTTQDSGNMSQFNTTRIVQEID